jgi:multiple sugar transport system substrate-binding protein
MKKQLITVKHITFCTLTAATLLMTGCKSDAAADSGTLDPKNPVTVTIWNYYNGDQLEAFEQLVEDFNSGIGAEKGIVALSVSQADISTLADSLLDSVHGKAGAQDIPTLAAVYSETAYILDEADALAPLDEYFTEDELAAYVPGFIEEGRFNKENQLMQFPILKSTEVFAANETDWEPFASDTGITLDSVKTQEDLTAAAESYYNWTDAQTPDIAEDGKSLYGRDSVGNYIFLGCYQLGHEMFSVKNGAMSVDMDRETFKTLWDNYYIPYINGYFGSYANFSSEDAKTGKILALTSSSSGMSYLPVTVTLSDDTTHDISIRTAKALPFAHSVNAAQVQQGASYCLLKSTPAQQEGAVEFLKWFSEPGRNLDFALMSGYSPVTRKANTTEAITAACKDADSDAKKQNMLDALLVSADVFEHNSTYASKPFSGSKDIRNLLESSMVDTAKADRAAVLEAIQSGKSREAAVSAYTSDSYFDSWFNNLCSEVNSIVKK